MRLVQRLLLVVLVFVFCGCAAVFREAKPKVHIDSEPTGAEARVRDIDPKPTPVDVEVERSGTSDVVVTKQGYEPHRGIIKKKLNGGWLTLDIVTCVIPVALCIPLLIDAITGAWNDVQKTYVVKLEPASAAAGTAAGAAAGAAVPPPVASATPVGTSTTPPPNPGAGMSESERKAAARAAYLEGAAAQDKGNCAEALPKFETAQKLYDAPTHLHHIAQCQAATGRLVEAQETYETLAHYALSPSAPDAFKQAQESGKKELAAIQPKIPTLRVGITPQASTLQNLQVTINGKKMPNELVGIARPMNPGTYTITATATGYKTANVDVVLKEGEQKPADVALKK